MCVYVGTSLCACESVFLSVHMCISESFPLPLYLLYAEKQKWVVVRYRHKLGKEQMVE